MDGNMKQVMNLIEDMSVDEKKIIFKRIKSEINGSLLDMLDTVNERAVHKPITMEEITMEVEAVRELAHGSN